MISGYLFQVPGKAIYPPQQPVASCIASTLSSVGDYPIILSTGSDKNYDFNYIKGNLKVVTVTSVDNDFKDGITIYPNPTYGKVRINFERLAVKSKVSVESINGETLYSFELNNSSFVDVDLSTHVSGMYFIKMNRGGQIIVNKIFKK